MNMLIAIGKWFVTSKWGLTILLAAAMTLGALLTYQWIAKSNYDRGRADCTADIIAKQAVENQRQDRENIKRNADASTIAKTADAAGETAVKATDTKTNETKEVIRYVYRDAPKTKPVVVGSCVHPVDDRVQDRFNQAVRAANG